MPYDLSMYLAYFMYVTNNCYKLHDCKVKSLISKELAMYVYQTALMVHIH